MATITLPHDVFGDDRLLDYLGTVNDGIITPGVGRGGWDGYWNVSAPRLRVNRRELSAYVPGGLTDEQWAAIRRGVYEMDSVTDNSPEEFVVEGPDKD